MMGWLLVVAMLANGMDNSNFYEREKATKTLITINNKYDLRGEIFLLTVSPKPEVASRAKSVIRSYYDVRPSVASENYLPKLTSFNGAELPNNDWQDIFTEAFNTEYTMTDGCKSGSNSWLIPDDLSNRSATKVIIRYWFSKGLNRKEVIENLNNMVKAEEKGLSFLPEGPNYCSKYFPFFPKQMGMIVIPMNLVKPTINLNNLKIIGAPNIE